MAARCHKCNQKAEVMSLIIEDTDSGNQARIGFIYVCLKCDIFLTNTDKEAMRRFCE